MVRQADNPFVCFGAKPDKGFELEISTCLEVGKGTREELDKGTERRQLAKGGEWPVDARHLRDQSDEIGSSRSQERPVKMSQHSLWVVEFSLEIHARVSLHMHIGNAMLHNSSSCTLSLPKLILFVCSLFFPPTPLILFFVAMKKYAMPLLEPLVDHRPRSEMI